MASSRDSSMGAPSTMHVPNLPSATRASASRTSCSTSASWSASANSSDATSSAALASPSVMRPVDECATAVVLFPANAGGQRFLEIDKALLVVLNVHGVFLQRCECIRDPPFLVQSRVLSLRVRQNRDVGVGIFPEREELAVGGACHGDIALQRVSASETEAGQRAPRKRDDHASVVDELVELRGGAGTVA